ncbi:hypothetical protein DSM07_08055 [Oenococcus sp. UCMA 16435]|nr:hypothetical protein DSM07_08055 [Oenococcus sp. UCMA 16435]
MFAVVIFHEILHWLPAIIFNRNPSLSFQYGLIPVVSYNNNQNYCQNLLITILPSLVLVIIGILLDGNNSHIIFLNY